MPFTVEIFGDKWVKVIREFVPIVTCPNYKKPFLHNSSYCGKITSPSLALFSFAPFWEYKNNSETDLNHKSHYKLYNTIY